MHVPGSCLMLAVHSSEKVQGSCAESTSKITQKRAPTPLRIATVNQTMDTMMAKTNATMT